MYEPFHELEVEQNLVGKDEKGKTTVAQKVSFLSKKERQAMSVNNIYKF